MHEQLVVLSWLLPSFSVVQCTLSAEEKPGQGELVQSEDDLRCMQFGFILSLTALAEMHSTQWVTLHN